VVPFLFEIVLGILEFLGELLIEAIFEYLCGALADALLRVAGTMPKTETPFSRITAFIGFGMLGTLFGGLSLLIFPHPLMHSRIHGISLLISPLVTGLMMSWTRSMFIRHGKKATEIQTFRYGFAFALGMALVRLFLTH